MKHRNKLICALTATMSLLTPTDSAIQAATNTPARSAIMADSLQRVLLNAKTANDSLALLTDIYDLSGRGHRDETGRKIVEIALRSGNTAVGLDAVRNLANNHFKNDSLLNLDMELASRFPDSDDRKETLTFIAMMKNLYSVRYSTPEERETQLRKLLREANAGNETDVYRSIVLLHAISLYIGESSQGDLLSKYLDRLGRLIENLRPEATSLRNIYYVQAAMVYTENEEYSKAINADTKLLKSIDDLESGRTGLRRKYRSYDANRYIAYTRLLANYPHLSKRDIEDYYRKVMDIVATDSTAATTNRISLRPQIYYAMYRQQYDKALELLKQAIDYPYNASCRRQMLKMAITAAEHTGDHETLLQASRDYNTMLENTLSQRNEEKYKELQLVYDINQMRAQHNRESMALERRMAIIGIVAAGILLLLLMLTLWLWIHSRKLARHLAASNTALQAESENLRLAQADLMRARDDAEAANHIKTDFIQNMSGEVTGPLNIITEYTNLIVDCSEANDKPYLRHFADLVNFNAELLKTTANDVLDLSEIDTNNVKLIFKRELIRPICEAAVDSVRHKLKPGVSLRLENNLPDISLNTDSRRLMRILIQLLSNAAKFTEEGEISLGYTVDNENGCVYIRVTDTGIGIKPEAAEYIFRRFVKINKSSQGIGIGLSIARHFADMLGGSLAVNTKYTLGAQFVLTLPLN